MRIHRCPRCRAEDISADAHPTRVVRGGMVEPALVCRRCYRAAELEFRIACETAGIPYEAVSIREGLVRLAGFYQDRIAEWERPEVLVDPYEREAAIAPIRSALDDVTRRLAIAAVSDA